MFAELQSALDVDSNVDWEVHFIDSTKVRAHQNAAGAKKSSAELDALARSRGGFTTKIHIRCEGTGRLITFLLTPGQESDIMLAEDLMETGSILRRNGHLRLHPKRLVADKGYTSSAFRSYLHYRNIRCTIPHRTNEHHKETFNKQIYCKRNIVERLINRLKQFRRITTRYEKTGR